MTKSLLPLRKEEDYESLVWHDSTEMPRVKFCVRRPSLAQRIRLTQRISELAVKQEFLLAGDDTDRLKAALSDLLARKIYIEWGLVEVKGLKIDSQPASPAILIEAGPERLLEEIVLAIKRESELSEDERKNS